MGMAYSLSTTVDPGFIDLTVVPSPRHLLCSAPAPSDFSATPGDGGSVPDLCYGGRTRLQFATKAAWATRETARRPKPARCNGWDNPAQ